MPLRDGDYRMRILNCAVFACSITEEVAWVQGVELGRLLVLAPWCAVYRCLHQADQLETSVRVNPWLLSNSATFVLAHVLQIWQEVAIFLAFWFQRHHADVIKNGTRMSSVEVLQVIPCAFRAFLGHLEECNLPCFWVHPWFISVCALNKVAGVVRVAQQFPQLCTSV